MYLVYPERLASVEEAEAVVAVATAVAEAEEVAAVTMVMAGLVCMARTVLSSLTPLPIRCSWR